MPKGEKNLDETPRVASRLLGNSATMAAVRHTIERVANSDAAVLISGETGTGKGLVATIIHARSQLRDGPFVSIDCSALAPSLLESELFGHVKGSFTGALSTKPGLLEIADGGTLFLDEVSNLSLETQSKLLSVLESGEFRPVGGVITKHVCFRLISATNRPLERMVNDGHFRQDLYYRLSVVPMDLPPLRGRRADVPMLLKHFLSSASLERGPMTTPSHFTRAALEQLRRYRWPGNIRELKNIVERLAVMVDEDAVQVEHLPDHFACPLVTAEPAVPRTNEELKAMKRAIREHIFDDLERSFVIAALRRCDGNISRAARETGLLRPNFHALMRKHGIHKGDTFDDET